jgi:hypothetical protein
VAFQHADDIQDGEHSALAADARDRIGTLAAQAIEALAALGPAAEPLRALASRVGR